MIPIIGPIVPIIPRDHDGRRPNIFGILLSVIILSVGIFLAFFLFLTGEFSSPMTIISVVMLLMVVCMGLIFATMAGTSASSHGSEREEYHRRQPPIRNYSKERREREYCPECGTLVDFSDSFCTTCGSRLDRWK
jgi:hypothetical protein